VTRPSKPAAIAFGVASGLLVAIKLLFEFYPGDFPVKGQAEAFTWPIVLGIILFALMGLSAERSLATGSRFPEPRSDRQRERRAAVIAIVTGFFYGIVTVVQDLGSPGSGNPLNVAEWPHVPWPWSVPFYTFGAILLEFMLRLGALCILVWLIHVVILRRRWLLPAFWIVNLIVATYEILPSVMEDVAAGKWRDVALSPLEPLYWTNVFEGWLLLRFGWLSPIVFRLAFYLIWHVIYGGLGPFS
jgi:cytochrome b561